MALKPLLTALVLLPGLAQAETCRFTGTTTGGGHLAVTAETTQTDRETTVNVAVTFAIAAWASDIRYYGQEITTWRGADLQSIAVNQRTLVDDSVKRQQWDVFTRNGPKLEAYRVQAKRLADFQQRHPGFQRHWPAASFAQPWLQDYQRAHPERRPDLDLPAAGARTPLALAFYWSRFLPPSGQALTLILPSFKRDAQAPLQIEPATQTPNWLRWSAQLRHPALDKTPASLAAAWVSPDHYLLQLGLEVHTSLASGQALIRAEGCQGIRPQPD